MYKLYSGDPYSATGKLITETESLPGLFDAVKHSIYDGTMTYRYTDNEDAEEQLWHLKNDLHFLVSDPSRIAAHLKGGYVLKTLTIR